jgi:hypothetical protein
MRKNWIGQSTKLALFALFSMVLLLSSSCIFTGEKNEAELIDDLLQKVAAMEGEMTVVTKDGETVKITVIKEAYSESQAADITKDNKESLKIDKKSSGSIDLASILPPLECIDDVFKNLGTWEDAHVLREKGLSWSHIAAELGYDKDTIHDELLGVAENHLKDAKESGFINQEMLEKKLDYFNELALKWVGKIFADTGEEQKIVEEEIEKFEGTIKAIDGHIWKVIDEEKIWIVDVSEAAIIREPKVGLRAFIVGIVKDDIFVAVEVEIEAVEEKEAIIDFKGTIKAVDGHIWKVIGEDKIWIVDVSEADIRMEPEIGLSVLVAGIVAGDFIKALEIDEFKE